MKSVHLLILASAFLSFAACSDATNRQDKAGEEKPAVEHMTPAEQHDAHQQALQLNNGEKWQSDDITKKHVRQLRLITDSFMTIKEPGAGDYHALAASLQKESDKLVADCKMTGAAHEALHLWLKAVLQDVADLGKVADAKDGMAVLTRTDNDIKQFDQYFK